MLTIMSLNKSQPITAFPFKLKQIRERSLPIKPPTLRKWRTIPIHSLDTPVTNWGFSLRQPLSLKLKGESKDSIRHYNLACLLNWNETIFIPWKKPILSFFPTFKPLMNSLEIRQNSLSSRWLLSPLNEISFQLDWRRESWIVDTISDSKIVAISLLNKEKKSTSAERQKHSL